MDIETKLLALLDGEFSSLSLSFNDMCSMNYMSVRQFVEEDYIEHITWISDAEKERAMETNSMWTLYWYPNTPVGFYSISASALEPLFKYLDENEFD